MTELTLELAKQLTQDAESTEFTVDFDELWQWCGYSKKSNAKRTLEENFEKNLDYKQRLLHSEQSDNHAGLSPQEKARSRLLFFIKHEYRALEEISKAVFQ